jgi:hypothetical protein
MKFYNKFNKPWRKNYPRSKYGITAVIKLRAERGVGSVRRIKRLDVVPSYTLDGSPLSYSVIEESTQQEQFKNS